MYEKICVGCKVEFKTKDKRIKYHSVKCYIKNHKVWNKGLKGKDYLKHYGEGKVWNQGLTKETDERVMKNTSGGSRKTQFKKGYKPKVKGKTWEEIYGEEKAKDIRKKNRDSHLGKIPWNKGKPFLGMEKNPNWLGGISFEPYNIDFSDSFRKAIRKRDNQICIMCGIPREKLNRDLCVHHTNYDKLLTIPENCVSLCLSCHIRTNYNRPHWTKFFQSLLTERYGYKYEDGIPVLQI